MQERPKISPRMQVPGRRGLEQWDRGVVAVSKSLLCNLRRPLTQWRAMGIKLPTKSSAKVLWSLFI